MIVLKGKLEDYKNAPSGIGPLAAELKDKPHRLIYDLYNEVKKLREEKEKLIDRREWVGDVITCAPFSYYNFPVINTANFGFATSRRQAIYKIKKSIVIS